MDWERIKNILTNKKIMTITAITIAVIGSLFLIIGMQTPFTVLGVRTKIDTIVNNGPSGLFDLTRMFGSKGNALLSLAWTGASFWFIDLPIILWVVFLWVQHYFEKTTSAVKVEKVA